MIKKHKKMKWLQFTEQAEAEVVPSSSLIEFEVWVGGSGLGLLFRSSGWLEIWRLKLISTQVVVEVEVWVELGNYLEVSIMKHL